MELEIFVPRTELERRNCEAIKDYLNSIFYC